MLVAYQALEEDIRAALKEHKGELKIQRGRPLYRFRAQIWLRNAILRSDGGFSSQASKA
jgi:hypothetical protein